MIEFSHLASYSDISERRQAIGYLRKIGAKIPTALDDAFATLDAVQRVNVTTTPSVDAYAIDPKNAEKITSDYVADVSRRAGARDGLNAVRGAVQARVIAECVTARDALLADPIVRAEFDAGSAVYTEHYPLVSTLRTAAAAADADQTGQALVAFRSVTTACKQLDKLTDALLDLLAPTPVEVRLTRSKMSAGRTLGLSATPPDSDAEYVAALDAAGVQGAKAAKGYPFGVYGVQVDAGAVLGLPRDTAEWTERAEFDPSAARTPGIHGGLVITGFGGVGTRKGVPDLGQCGLSRSA